MKYFFKNFFFHKKEHILSIRNVLKSIFFLIIIFCLLFLGETFFNFQEKFAFFKIEENIWLVTLLFFIFQEFIFFLSVFIFNPKTKEFWLKILSWKKISWKTTLKLVLKWYGFFILFSIFLSLLNYYNIEIPGFKEQKDIMWIFGDWVFNQIIAFITISILWPFVEEVFFRGYLLQTFLKKVSNPIIASVITAVIFSLAHLDLSSAGSIFVIALIINNLYIQSKSIIPGFVFHILNNSIAFLVLSIFKG